MFKDSSVEWWYTDLQKFVKIKLYPVFPPVRPTVLRFVTELSSVLKNTTENDILDASILLRNVNVDDSGTYRCLIRPWATDSFEQLENILFNDDSNIGALEYELRLTGLSITLTTTTRRDFRLNSSTIVSTKSWFIAMFYGNAYEFTDSDRCLSNGISSMCCEKSCTYVNSIPN